MTCDRFLEVLYAEVDVYAEWTRGERSSFLHHGQTCPTCRPKAIQAIRNLRASGGATEDPELSHNLEVDFADPEFVRPDQTFIAELERK